MLLLHGLDLLESFAHNHNGDLGPIIAAGVAAVVERVWGDAHGVVAAPAVQDDVLKAAPPGGHLVVAAASSGSGGHTTAISITGAWGRDQFWMYCTSIYIQIRVYIFTDVALQIITKATSLHATKSQEAQHAC